jgi:hypothetical protein
MTERGLTLAEAAIIIELFRIFGCKAEAVGVDSRLTWKLFM